MTKIQGVKVTATTRTLRRIIATGLFSILAALFCHAQANDGQISGNVTDPSGALVANAAIRATNTATGSVYDTRSTSSGSYRLPQLAIGSYTVTAEAPQFKRSVKNDVIVQVGTITAVNFSLALGSSSETVSVQADSVALETESADVGGVITSKQIQELPLALGGLGQFRAIESFAFLVPGTVGPGTATANQGGSSAQTAGIYLTKLGGGQNFVAQVLLDGLSVQREENGSTFDETAPSVEAISEFKVTTSTPPAQYGRTTGGIENFATKSGANEYHGSVFDIFRNTALDANDWFDNGWLANCAAGDTACRKAHARALDMKNDYGVSLGGPVSIPHVFNGKGKLFFFYSFEQFRKSQATAVISSVPTALMRNGDFSELLAAGGGPNGKVNPCDGKAILNGEIFDPSTSKNVGGVDCRLPFQYGGKLNVIDPSKITALGRAIINAYPTPQNGQLQNNYTYRTAELFGNTAHTIRVDQSLTDKLKTFESYSVRENAIPFGGGAPMYPGPAGGKVTQDFITHYGRVGINYSFSPHVLNSLAVGTNRIYNSSHSAEVADGVNYAQKIGISGITSNAFPNLIPQGNQFGIGISPLGASTNATDTETHFLLSDQVVIEKGRNTISLGFEDRYTQFIAGAMDNANGQIYGWLPETMAARFNSGYESGTGFGLAGLELGLPDYVRYATPQDPKWLTNSWAGFAQVDRKVNQQLTITAGLRYEVDAPRHEARNQTSNFSPTAIDPKNGRPGALVFGVNCHCNSAWADTYYKDFGPRLGFAYSPASMKGQTVIRGGGAILYAPLLYADFGTSMQQGFKYTLGVAGDGFGPALDLNQGIPAHPPLPNLDPGQLDTGDANSTQEVNDIQKNYGRNGMISQWNLQVQQQITPSAVFTLGYIGEAGQNLLSFLTQPNNMPTKYLALGDKLFSHDLVSAGVPSPYAGFNGNVGQALRPFPQYSNLTPPTDIENAGHNTYHAMIANLRHRGSHGLTLDLSYTWSKTITDADSGIGGINGGTPGLIQDPSNLKTAKSISIQDIPNNFVASYLYDLPIGKGHSLGSNMGRGLDAIFGGWTIGGVQRYQSGVPFSFGCAAGVGQSFYNNCFSFTQLPGSSLRSNLSKSDVKPFLYLLNPGAPPDPTRDSIFNGLRRTDNAAYSALQPSPALYDQNNGANRNGGPFTFGNLPRVTGAARNFAYLNEDLVLIKNSRLYRERYSFQLKAEFLNAFNRHNFNSPDSNPYNNDFGVPTSVVGGATDSQRRIQLTGRITY